MKNYILIALLSFSFLAFGSVSYANEAAPVKIEVFEYLYYVPSEVVTFDISAAQAVFIEVATFSEYKSIFSKPYFLAQPTRGSPADKATAYVLIKVGVDKTNYFRADRRARDGLINSTSR